MHHPRPQNSSEYRREIAGPLFKFVRAHESCAIIGLASMGKSRFCRFILQATTQQHYLGSEASSIMFIHVDGNRLAAISEWGLFELVLSALTEASGRHQNTVDLRSSLNDLRREAIVSRDDVLARRYVELCAYMLCEERNLSLCFLLDEFDNCYRTLPPLALSNLRALRDSYKYQLSYVMFLREHPMYLRPINECESFYELFARSVTGMRPYSEVDTYSLISELEARELCELDPSARIQLYHMSGGHPGLILSIFATLCNETPPKLADWDLWTVDQPLVKEECQKLWASLSDPERAAITRLLQGGVVDQEMQRRLQLKGLIVRDNAAETIFSSTFGRYAKHTGNLDNQELRLDEPSRVIWVGDAVIANLTAREFDMIQYLYQRAGQMCTRDDILNALYPGEEHYAQDNVVDSLVKRVREKIEPIREQPIYLLTVRSRGYKLVTDPRR